MKLSRLMDPTLCLSLPRDPSAQDSACAVTLRICNQISDVPYMSSGVRLRDGVWCGSIEIYQKLRSPLPVKQKKASAKRARENSPFSRGYVGGVGHHLGETGGHPCLPLTRFIDIQY